MAHTEHILLSSIFIDDLSFIRKSLLLQVSLVKHAFSQIEDNGSGSNLTKVETFLCIQSYLCISPLTVETGYI